MRRRHPLRRPRKSCAYGGGAGGAACLAPFRSIPAHILGGHGLSPGKPRHEGAGGFLIAAVVVAPAAERLGFGGGNARHLAEEKKNHGRRKQPRSEEHTSELQ